jgi:transposase
MSLHPQTDYPIPEETQRVARAAFPKGNLCLHLADVLGPLYQDQQFTALFHQRGQPGLSPARLALVLILQFVEGLPDRQAAEAVRSRIDWKYALGLELTHPGFDFSVLSEFRDRLLAAPAEQLLFETLLTKLQEVGVLKKRGRQRTDSTHVLAAVRGLNRLERVGETLRAALNALAVVAPEWLQALAPAEWYERYGERVENFDLPRAEKARQELAATIAADGQKLLTTIDAAPERSWLREVPAVKILRRVWAEQYVEQDGVLVWRAVPEMPPSATLITSPYEADARYSTKSGTEWVGYKVQMTETCDEQLPHLIVNVETTPATTSDDNMAEVIHQSLAQKDLRPAEHLVDKGYTDAEALLDSQQRHGVELRGPVADDPSWQARAGTGFDRSSFIVDWAQQKVTCPAGKHSRSWLPNVDPTKEGALVVRFSRRDGSPCPFRSPCTKRKEDPRELLLPDRARHEALQNRRQEQATEEFRARYATRAGIEATHAQALRRCGLRQCRYIGLAKTRLQHILTAIAINLLRLEDWWRSLSPAKTRRSRFARLQPLAA